MTFLNPLGLIGLLSLPVIVGLHLLRERHRRYVVSHLGLWSFLEQHMHGPRIRRLPLTLILLLDLLIATLLSLAWAQPRLTLPLNAQRARHMVILLDVSTSMRAVSGRDSRFDGAKAEAQRILNEAGPEDVVTVIAAGRQARVLGDSRQDGSTLLATRISLAQAGETGQAIPEALALGQAALEETLPPEFHIVTDGSYPQESLKTAAQFPHPVQWHLVGDSVDNQTVIAFNATPLGDNRVQVFARIANFGSNIAAREVVLEVDGELIDQEMVAIPADASLPRVWQVALEPSKQPIEVIVTVQGNDGMDADDSAALGLQSAETARVALVAEDPAVIQQAILAIPETQLEVLSPQEYQGGRQDRYDLTIFRSYLPPVWPEGNVLVVDPPTADAGLIPETGGISAGRQQEIAANSSAQSRNSSPLVEGIDFSGVRWARAWRMERLPEGFLPVLQANDVPLLLQGEVRQSDSQRSPVAVLLADLTAGNFTRHPAFPILMANVVEWSRQAPVPDSFQTGESILLPDPGSYRAIAISVPGQGTTNLEGDWPEVWAETTEAGLYHFRFTDAQGEVSEFMAGARAGDAVESDLRPRSWTQSVSEDERVEGILVEEQQQLDLRPWLLGAAILIFLVEAILAWRS